MQINQKLKSFLCRMIRYCTNDETNILVFSLRLHQWLYSFTGTVLYLQNKIRVSIINEIKFHLNFIHYLKGT